MKKEVHTTIVQFLSVLSPQDWVGKQIRKYLHTYLLQKFKKYIKWKILDFKHNCGVFVSKLHTCVDLFIQKPYLASVRNSASNLEDDSGVHKRGLFEKMHALWKGVE